MLRMLQRRNRVWRGSYQILPRDLWECLDPIMSGAVIARCTHRGDYDAQVFEHEKRATSETASRTTRQHLPHTDGTNTIIGTQIAEGTALCLSAEESRYIHNEVLKMRSRLHTPEGRAYVEEISRRAKETTPPPATHVAPGRLTPLSDLLVPFEMPPEPNWDDEYEIARDEQQTGDEPYQF